MKYLSANQDVEKHMKDSYPRQRETSAKNAWRGKLKNSRESEPVY